LPEVGPLWVGAVAAAVARRTGGRCAGSLYIDHASDSGRGQGWRAARRFKFLSLRGIREYGSKASRDGWCLAAPGGSANTCFAEFFMSHLIGSDRDPINPLRMILG